MMQIRLAELEELDRIMEIYAHARRFMAETGNPKQWGATNWPPRTLIEQDIRQKHCYVCCKGRDLLGVFYYNYGTNIDPAYQYIVDGIWNDDSPYGVVHRIASAGTEKGVGRFCIRWAVEQSGGHLRMDTHGDNKIMQNLLHSLGFIHCGTIYVTEDNDPRLAFEKSVVVTI